MTELEAGQGLAPSALADLAERFRGELFRPGEAGYEEARAIWNAAIERRPAVIARATGAEDVVEAVRFARDRGLLLAVRAGGHNVAGNALCDGGIVVDVSRMKTAHVDEEAMVVTAGPGLTLGEIDRATQAAGLATPVGINSTTGLSGLTLGGGIGWLMRKHGLACDNLLSADVVTADGERVRATEDEHPDLLWALRGGGGNFGVVTEYRFRLHPLGPTVLAGPVLYPAESAPEVLRGYRDAVNGLSEDVGTGLFLRSVPPLPAFPEELHGRSVVQVALHHHGDGDGERLLRPLRRLGEPLLDLVAERPHVQMQAMFDAAVPPGQLYYWKSHDLPPLTDDAIDTMVERAWKATQRSSYTIVFHLGGAVARIGEDDTAYSGRSAGHAININAATMERDGFEADVQWCRDFFAAMEPHATGGVYVNFLGNEGEGRVQAAYGESKLERLRGVKAAWDPDNFFRVNQNIRPH